MDNHGVDHMILYPTVGFWTTGVAEMDGETASAIRRAYNRWLGNFCQEIGRGACGAASIDLRDPAAVAADDRGAEGVGTVVNAFAERVDGFVPGVHSRQLA